MKKLLKKLLVGEGRAGRKIPFGLYKGITLSIDPAVESNFYLGLYERETVPWLRGAGRKARSLVDAGAGCGELSAWGLSQRNIEKVMAFDSSPDRWPIFDENMRLNGFDRDDRLTAVHGMFLGPDDASDADRIIGSLPEPILLKIDVDGGEQAILENMRHLLSRKRCLFLIETHSRELDEACYRILEEARYRVSRIRPAWWRCILPEQRPSEFNQWLVAERD